MKRNRRWMTAGLASAALTLPVLLASVGAHAQVPQLDEPTPPNVIVIVTDDQREGLQVMSKTRAALADNGRLFENAFVTTPLLQENGRFLLHDL